MPAAPGGSDGLGTVSRRVLGLAPIWLVTAVVHPAGKPFLWWPGERDHGSLKQGFWAMSPSSLWGEKNPGLRGRLAHLGSPTVSLWVYGGEEGHVLLWSVV